MGGFRVRPGAWIVVPAALFLCQCKSSPAPAAGTFRGLSLEEWSAIPWKGSLNLHNGSGSFELKRDIYGSIEALGAFAAESEPALERLRALVADLDEDVREEAAAQLALLAFSRAPNQSAAMEALLGWIRSDAAAPASAALMELVIQLEERDDWTLLGPQGEQELVARAEALLFEFEAYSMEIAFGAWRVLATRASEHGARLLAALQSPAERFRCEEAADELRNFAADFEREDCAALAPTLFQRAAELAVELEPDSPESLDTLARIYARLGDSARALEASSRALEAASRSEDSNPRLHQRIQEHFELLSGKPVD